MNSSNAMICMPCLIAGLSRLVHQGGAAAYIGAYPVIRTIYRGNIRVTHALCL